MIIESLLISLSIQLLIFLPAYKYKTDKLTDISYALTFIILSWTILLINQLTTEKLILAIMITLWGLRLGLFLFKRVRKTGKDKRFDGIRENFTKFLSFWLIQGITVWLVMMSASIFLSQEKTNLNILSIIGLAIWAVGLITESVADHQKFAFKQDIKNKNKWINTGLWKHSRHPNYFGEITHWVGIYIYCLATLNGINALIGLVTPAYITITLLFISGIPILERNADLKWGKNKDYLNYKKKTSILIPWI